MMSSGAPPPDLPSRAAAPVPSEPPPRIPAASAPPPRGTARRGATIALGALLAVAAIGLAILVVAVVQLRGAVDALEVDLERTTDELHELEQRYVEQREQLEEKEVFGRSMHALMSTVESFDGVPTATIVDLDGIESLARAAWADRRAPAAVREHTAAVDTLRADYERLLADAAERRSNASGTAAEALIDALGHGFVETVWGDASAVCEMTALGCVWGGEPLVIHLDSAGFAEPYRTEWGERLVAYHEFAHVLQFTNPLPTVDALEAFGGDSEIMADCYALTMLDAWTLEERVWQSSTSYWDVSYGYGYVCDGAQRDVIRDWVAAVGVQYRPVSQ